ncbi:MAG: sugar porter family MFS transporter [Acidobacteria bacterium]|nr:sugar porter family MFS transporter [Acidobacteriota bacterium]
MAQAGSSGGTSKLVYFFGALGGLLFGYDTGKIAGAIIFVQADLQLTAFLEGLVVSSLLIGAAIGAGTCGPLSDRLGRRRVILIAALIFAGTAIGEALSPNAATLIFMRLIGGLAVGAASLTVPLYLSEMAPARIRGAIASLNQLMIVIGILSAFIVNYTLADTESWRWMFGAAFFPAMILLVGMIFMPETPRWLVLQDREEEAREVLRRTRPESEIDHEMAEIERIDNLEEEEGGGLRELLRATWIRPALVVAIGLAVFQQIVGINTIIYYAPTTLTNVGFEDSAAILANVGIGIVNVLLTLVAIYLIDRIGRKPLLLGGLVGMVASLTVLGVSTLSLPEPASPTDPVAIITLVCLGLFIASFAATWGPVVWVMLPEILPLKLRGTAMGVAIILHWLANFLVSLTFPILLDTVGLGLLFLGYAGIGVLAFVFVRALVTETKGRSLEEIETDLREKVLGYE